MKILVTGAHGFIGKNLVAELKNNSDIEVYEYLRGMDEHILNGYCENVDFVFHFAGVNRPLNEFEFMDGNFKSLQKVLKLLGKNNNSCPVLYSSSIQAELDNAYGKSKKAAEELLLDYGKKNGADVYILRLPNVFGKWCKPNYNSVVATFCHNIANDLEIKINDPEAILSLVYIDDVISTCINLLNYPEKNASGFINISNVHKISLSELANIIYKFKSTRENYLIPDLSDELTKKMYSTYISYLSKDKFDYDLKMNVDERGSFTEFLKSPDRGQVSVNISKPGIVKGEHWHHTKNEKFLVVSGSGVIRFRKIGDDEIIEYFVDGDKLRVVDIPVGYTHNIENLGKTDMVTIMWASEAFNPEKPDTYYLKVKK